MKINKWSTLGLVGFLSLGGWVILHQARRAAQGAELMAPEIVLANNSFALSMYSQLVAIEGNWVFSPVSLHSGLTMSYAGAHGRTAEQMAQALCISNNTQTIHTGYAAILKTLTRPDEDGSEFNVANSIWCQKNLPVVRGFSRLVKEDYAATLGLVDFSGAPAQACNAINSLISSHTRGRIPEFLDPGMVGPDTDLVLLNTVYLKASWQQPFAPEETKMSPFRLLNGGSVLVPMMNWHGQFRLFDGPDVQLLELPFDVRGLELLISPPHSVLLPTNRFSMILLLPKKSDGLLILERGLTAAQIDKMYAESSMESVWVSLPRFRVSSRLRLNNVLRDMGMSDAFEQARADFTGISRRRPLFVHDVLHHVWLQIDERGVEAASASAVAYTHSAADVMFQVNHPFLFLIRHNPDGAILFMGRITDPLH
jgi:serpin B